MTAAKALALPMALAFALAVAPPGPVRAASAAEAAPGLAEPLELVLAGWSARALGRQADGYLAWVRNGGGDLRLEILGPGGEGSEGAGGSTLRDDDEALAALLARRGTGWTLVAGSGDNPGVVAPWDREWRPAPAGLAALARAVAGARPGSRSRLVLDGGDVAEAGSGEARPGSGRPAGPRPAGTLRAALAERGRGGGGPGERLVVAGGPGGVVTIVSSRRPGALAVHPRPPRGVAGDPAAVFTPWWPLAELLSPAGGGTEAGTSAPDPR